MTIKLSLSAKFLILTFMIKSVCFAQSPIIDSSSISKQVAEAFFYKEIKSQSWLFNGTAYLTYGSNVQGSANFQDLSLTNGTVVYDGVRYDKVPLLYDLYLDNIVSISYGNTALVSLIRDKLSDFYINKHHFIYLNVSNEQIGSQSKNGFFDLIYDGKIRVLVKRSKKLQISNNVEMPYYFTDKTAYFLERDNKYYEFSNEKSFLNLFKDNKNEMKKHLQETNIKFKDNPDEAIAILANYHDRTQN